MAAHNELVEHCRELLAPLGAVRVKRMFGGHGFYVDELFIALIAFGRLYLKADASTRARFEAAGCEPFVYDGKGQTGDDALLHRAEDAMESPALMQPWARLALEGPARQGGEETAAKPPGPLAERAAASAAPPLRRAARTPPPPRRHRLQAQRLRCRAPVAVVARATARSVSQMRPRSTVSSPAPAPTRRNLAGGQGTRFLRLAHSSSISF